MLQLHAHGRGFRGHMLPPENFENIWYSFVHFGVYFDQRFFYLAHEEIFENMLQLKHFGLYCERILSKKWLLSYRKNDISCTHAREFGGILPEKI